MEENTCVQFYLNISVSSQCGNIEPLFAVVLGGKVQLREIQKEEM